MTEKTKPQAALSLLLPKLRVAMKKESGREGALLLLTSQRVHDAFDKRKYDWKREKFPLFAIVKRTNKTRRTFAVLTAEKIDALGIKRVRAEFFEKGNPQKLFRLTRVEDIEVICL